MTDGQNPKAESLVAVRRRQAHNPESESPRGRAWGKLSMKTERTAKIQKDVKMKDDPDYLLKIKEIKATKRLSRLVHDTKGLTRKYN